MATNTNIISPIQVEDRRKLDIHPGDTVKVWQKIQEKGKVRLQAFEGLVLSRKHGTEAGATFTVRKVIDGVGVEKIFPLYTPVIDKIELLRRSKVRRAKLYFVREKATKERLAAAKRSSKERRIFKTLRLVVMPTTPMEKTMPLKIR